jgi:hypothetical protein
MKTISTPLPLSQVLVSQTLVIKHVKVLTTALDRINVARLVVHSCVVD